METLKNIILEIQKDLNNLKISSASFLRKEELEYGLKKVEKMKTELEKTLENLKELQNIKDIEGKIEKIRIERENILEKLENLEQLFDLYKILKNDVQELKDLQNKVVLKFDFEKIKNRLNKEIIEIEKMKNEINKKLNEISKINISDLNKRIENLEKENKELSENLVKIIDLLKIVART